MDDADHVRPQRLCLDSVRPVEAGLSARGAAQLVSGGYPLQTWSRRHFDAVRTAHDVPNADMHSGVVWADRETRQGIYDRVPRARDPNDRRVRGARSRAVLPLLRGWPDPDVLDHRHLGRQASRLCSVQVLPLHAGRIAVDAACHNEYVLDRRDDRYRSTLEDSLRALCAKVALARLFRFLRCEDADVAGAYLVA